MLTRVNLYLTLTHVCIVPYGNVLHFPYARENGAADLRMYLLSEEQSLLYYIIYVCYTRYIV